jgi:transporter family-2 protein
MQSRINGDLGARLHDGIAAATISFGIGMLILLALVPGTRAGRRGLAGVRAALRARTLRPWQCLGGVCGAYLVVTQGVAVASLGVAVYTVALVAGQSGSSLAVDRAGIGPAGPEPLTVARVAGAVLAVVAVFIAVADRLGNPATLSLALLPALAGVGVAWQQATNGRVRVAAGAALPATFVNFLAGMCTLAIAFAIDVAVRGWPSGHLPTEPWLYVGGPLGIVFIALAASVVRHTGVLLLALSMIAGQLVGALAIDLIAPTGAGPSHLTLVGVGLTLIAVIVTAMPSRKRPS